MLHRTLPSDAWPVEVQLSHCPKRVPVAILTVPWYRNARMAHAVTLYNMCPQALRHMCPQALRPATAAPSVRYLNVGLPQPSIGPCKWKAGFQENVTLVPCPQQLSTKHALGEEDLDSLVQGASLFLKYKGPLAGMDRA